MQAATTAASQGATVTVVEKDVIGGAAHLWDCIPSKTMAASALRHTSVRNAFKLGLVNDPGQVDMANLSDRIKEVTSDINERWVDLLSDQNVEMLEGRGRFVGPNEAEVDASDGPRRVHFDVALISTGSAPRVPDWAPVDGKRVLTTRDAYDFDEVPEHMIVVGSGVTGVEFTHIFEAMGSEVTLVVSRQQILPHRDAEVAAVLEEDFLERGIKLVIGARAESIDVSDSGVTVSCNDGRTIRGSHVLLAVGSVPLTDGLGLAEAGVTTDDRGYVPVDGFQRSSVSHIYAAGDVTGQMPLSSVASMQGRKIARHMLGLPVDPIDYDKVTEAIFTEPEIASVGLAEVDAAAQGRKVRTTKVPFTSNARSVLQDFTRGFVKVTSDPATGIVLGGTIVGHRASELIGAISLAVQARATTHTLVETLLAHPSMIEAISDAGE